MPIKTIGVLGCGLMGSGIAQVAAAAGYRTIVREVDSGLLERGLGRIDRFLAAGVEKGKVQPSERDRILANLSGTTDLSALAACDLVIEAIVEQIDDKAASYRILDDVLGEHAIVCSNTSSLCITELASKTRRPDRFAGLHFFNPVPLMKLVEVVRGLTTSDATAGAVQAFARSLGKEPIAAPDRPGFIVNRLLVPYMADAIRALEEGVGTADQIDAAMKAGAGHPVGPLMLNDLVGLDTLKKTCDNMYEELRDPRFAPPPTLRKLVAAGWHGRKTGMGFYDWSGPEPVPNSGAAR